MIFFLFKSHTTIPVLIQVFDTSSKIAEYSVNWSKWELMSIGENLVIHPVKEYQFPICTKSIKYLGMYILKNITQ